MSLQFACIWLHTEALEQAFKSKNINWGGYFLDQAPTWTVLISFWVPLPTTYLCLWHIVHGKYIWYVWFTVIESRAKVITVIPVVIQSPCCFPTSLLSFYMVYPFSFPWASPPVPWDSLSLVLTLLSPGSVFYCCPLRVRSIPQLSSHRQSNNDPMAITFHHCWPQLHHKWLFCDASGLITDILKYAALLKLLCAWLWR